MFALFLKTKPLLLDEGSRDFPTYLPWSSGLVHLSWGLSVSLSSVLSAQEGRRANGQLGYRRTSLSTLSTICTVLNTSDVYYVLSLLVWLTRNLHFPPQNALPQPEPGASRGPWGSTRRYRRGSGDSILKLHLTA